MSNVEENICSKENCKYLTSIYPSFEGGSDWINRWSRNGRRIVDSLGKTFVPELIADQGARRAS